MVEKRMKFYIDICKRLAKIRFDKEKVKPSRELVDSIEFLGWDITPEEVVLSAKSATIISSILLLTFSVIGFLIGIDILFLIFLTVGIPILLNHVISEYPKILAREKAMEALGESPQIIAQLSISLKQNPNLERAIEFVSKHGNGEISKDFRKYLRDIWSGKIKNSFEVLENIGNKWGKWSEGFQRSVYTILSSFYEKDRKKKEKTLDRAVEIILNDTIDKMNEYAMGLHMPTLALFSFGIIMPLILVSLFPLVSFLGVSMSLESIIVFLIISLIGVFLYSTTTLKRRPASLSLINIKPKIPSGYIKLSKFILPGIPFVTSVIIFISIPSIIYLIGRSETAVIFGPLYGIGEFFNTFPLIWAISIGISLYFFGKYYHLKIERDRIRKLESSIPYLLYSLRDSLSEGKPIEESLEFSLKMQPKGVLSDQLKKAVNLIKRRHISVKEALIGNESPFEKNSNLLNSVLSLISTSLERGIEATAQTCDITIKYLTRLKEVEKSMIDMLSRTMSMMKMTAVIFAPVVSAIIVVLFYMIVKGVVSVGIPETQLGAFSSFQNFSQPKIPAPILQLVLGLYAIGLNFVLIRYITIVNYGYDKIQIGNEIAKTTLVSVAVFTLTLLFMKSVMGI